MKPFNFDEQTADLSALQLNAPKHACYLLGHDIYSLSDSEYSLAQE